MQALMYHRIRDGFSALTKKLVPEVLVSILAIVLVIVLFSNVAKGPLVSSQADRTGFDRHIAATSNQKTVDFMERVALSHVGEPKSSTAAAVASAPKVVSADAKAEPAAAVAAPAALPHPPRLASAPAREKPHTAATHVAASVPAVLPPPRPPFAAPEPVPVVAESPVVVPEAQKPEPLRPLRYGVHLVTQIVDFVPASGTRVFEGMASIGGALASFAKKL